METLKNWFSNLASNYPEDGKPNWLVIAGTLLLGALGYFLTGNLTGFMLGAGAGALGSGLMNSAAERLTIDTTTPARPRTLKPAEIKSEKAEITLAPAKGETPAQTLTVDYPIPATRDVTAANLPTIDRVLGLEVSAIKLATTDQTTAKTHAQLSAEGRDKLRQATIDALALSDQNNRWNQEQRSKIVLALNNNLAERISENGQPTPDDISQASATVQKVVPTLPTLSDATRKLLAEDRAMPSFDLSDLLRENRTEFRGGALGTSGATTVKGAYVNIGEGAAPVVPAGAPAPAGLAISLAELSEIGHQKATRGSTEAAQPVTNFDLAWYAKQEATDQRREIEVANPIDWKALEAGLTETMATRSKARSDLYEWFKGWSASDDVATDVDKAIREMRLGNNKTQLRQAIYLLNYANQENTSLLKEAEKLKKLVIAKAAEEEAEKHLKSFEPVIKEAGQLLDSGKDTKNKMDQMQSTVTQVTKSAAHNLPLSIERIAAVDSPNHEESIAITQYNFTRGANTVLIVNEKTGMVTHLASAPDGIISSALTRATNAASSATSAALSVIKNPANLLTPEKALAAASDSFSLRYNDLDFKPVTNVTVKAPIMNELKDNYIKSANEYDNLMIDVDNALRVSTAAAKFHNTPAPVKDEPMVASVTEHSGPGITPAKPKQPNNPLLNGNGGPVVGA